VLVELLLRINGDLNEILLDDFRDLNELFFGFLYKLIFLIVEADDDDLVLALGEPNLVFIVIKSLSLLDESHGFPKIFLFIAFLLFLELDI
jgi:hypothetical protein